MNEFVVGVDGSDPSRMALRWAAAAGKAAGVPVRAIQSWTHPGSAMLPIGPVPVPSDEMDERMRQALADVVADTLGSPDAVATRVLRGSSAGALLETLTGDSVLVLGSRGLGGFKGLLLGSVSQECVEYAPCPVVVVRTERTLGDGDLILVGKDGSEGAQGALAWAHALAGATGAGLRAVHAWRGVASERRPGKTERLRSRAADAVEGWTQEIDDDIESDEVEGDPRDVLVSAAERLSPALIVVGRRGAGGLRSMRLGSTANHLVRHSATNVAVVPAP
ncbi:MAG TPA: universal stress protein [Acidimicrobiales bacterium]|nr:universal stress protein [Acidimicrobiales bacterium]